MIKMIKGTYGLVVNGAVEAMTPRSAPFELSEEREAELVAAGVAVKAEKPKSRYDGMKMTELREVAAVNNVDVTGLRSRKALIAALESAGAPVWPEEEKQYSGLLDED